MMGAGIVEARYAELEALAGRFVRAEGQMQALARSVAQCADVLRRGGWEGRGKEAFVAEMDGVLTPALGRLIAALDEAGSVTRQMSEVMAAAEEDAARLFEVGGAAVMDPGAMGASIDSAGVDRNSLLSMALFIGGGQRLIKIADLLFAGLSHRMMLNAGLLSIARVANLLMGARGNVGRMQRLYRALVVKGVPYWGPVDTFIRVGKAARVLAVTDAVFGLAEDIHNDTFQGDWGKAIGVNLLNGAMQYGVASTGVGGAVLLGNAANQLWGDVRVGGMNLYADYAAANDSMRQLLSDDADSMAAAYKQMDVTNITKELAEGIWDGYGEALTPHRNMAQAYWTAFNDMQRDPSWETMGRVVDHLGQASSDNAVGIISSTVSIAYGGPLFTTNAGRSGLVDALKATGNVVDGFVDAGVISGSNLRNIGLNEIQRGVQHLPISDNLKQGISDAALGAARWNQGQQQWATNLINF